MTASTLAWTLYGPLEDETSVLDPLGFDYFAQLLGNVVLPSFTSRTGRARYYSMVAYGIYISHEYLKSLGCIYRDRDVLDAFKLYERYWARAIVEFYSCYDELAERDGKEQELRGKRGVIRAYNEGVKTLDFKFLTHQLELGGLGAYRSSMESLELLKSNLTLTHKGMALAKSFLDTKFYDKMIIHAMRDEDIVMKEGNQTLQSLGAHTCLDGNSFEYAKDLYQTKHLNENSLLQEFILNNVNNIIAVSLIYQYRDIEVPIKNPMHVVEAIANTKLKTNDGRTVANGYKTIFAFENLAIAINRVWCSIIRNAQNNMGRISITETVLHSTGYLDVLRENQYIKILMEQSAYRNIKESLHGTSFAVLLQEFEDMTETDYPEFIVALVHYHISVMNRRNSGAWMLLDGTDIIVTSGYDYPRKTEKVAFLHGYKVTNIINIIEDTEWIPNGKVY
ncbi:hypothetical protein ACTQ6A_00075 [Lachnospiraceae bacterium LCP25S3_G4]